MIRIQLHLTEAQNRALKALAKTRGATRADVIRRAIDLLLAQGFAERDALAELIGAAGAGPSADLSQTHDRLLYAGGEPTLPVAAESRPERRK